MSLGFVYLRKTTIQHQMTFGEYIGQLNRVANKILLILCIPFILYFGYYALPIIFSVFSAICFVQGLIYITKYIILKRPNPEDEILSGQVSTGTIIAMVVGSAVILAFSIWWAIYLFRQ